MTLYHAQKTVADDFEITMLEDEYETFAEMRKSQRWTTKEIKIVINEILDMNNTGWHIDEVDYTQVINQDTGEMVAYKDFINCVYKIIRKDEKNS